ncbi:hypothetical protein [Lactococcus sp. FSL W8-0209]|uniref:hypothetical protein n=1 Tax=Lactococcus sp. FSL W8-0209 TaxID=2921712 RepID=UPI0030F5C92C
MSGFFGFRIATWLGGNNKAAINIFILWIALTAGSLLFLLIRELVNIPLNKTRSCLQTLAERSGMLKQDQDDKHTTITAKFKVWRENGLDWIEYFPRASKVVSYDELPNLLIEVFEEISGKPWILVKAQPTRTSLIMSFQHEEDTRLTMHGADEYAKN